MVSESIDYENDAICHARLVLTILQWKMKAIPLIIFSCYYKTRIDQIFSWSAGSYRP